MYTDVAAQISAVRISKVNIFLRKLIQYFWDFDLHRITRYFVLSGKGMFMSKDIKKKN